MDAELKRAIVIASVLVASGFAYFRFLQHAWTPGKWDILQGLITMIAGGFLAFASIGFVMPMETAKSYGSAAAIALGMNLVFNFLSGTWLRSGNSRGLYVLIGSVTAALFAICVLIITQSPNL